MDTCYVWRENNHWYAMEPSSNPSGGNYSIDRSCTISVQYHSVSYRVNIESGIDLWTSYTPCHASSIVNTQQIILEDNFQKFDDMPINIVGNTAVHSDTGKAERGTWHIFQDQDYKR